MSAADPGGALATYLLTTPVATICSDRIYRPELPTGPGGNVPSMPQACVVIRRAGGYALFGGGNVPIGDPLLDLFCYGETWFAAEVLAAEAVNALRALSMSVWEWTDPDLGAQRTRLYWARIIGGPTPFEDPETNWPCSVVSSQLAHCELQLA